MKELNIGLFGFGTVGTGIYKVLGSARNAHAAIRRICVRSLAKKRSVDLPEGMITDNPADILNDPEIDLIVEVVDNADASYSIVTEALRRGLDCETSTPLIYDRYLDPSSIGMFENMKVMKRHELEARNEIKWETYYKKIQIESRVLGDLCMNHIIPVATKYQSELVDNVHKIQLAFSDPKQVKALTAYNIDLIEKINKHTSFIAENVDAMVEKRREVNRIEDVRTLAIAYHDEVAPYLDSIRYHIDKLELIVEDEMWTLPKYRELLFIR